jgi:hypothetical protein
VASNIKHILKRYRDEYLLRTLLVLGKNNGISSYAKHVGHFRFYLFHNKLDLVHQIGSIGSNSNKSIDIPYRYIS